MKESEVILMFKFTDESIPEILKGWIIEVFMQLRNEAAKRLNPMYDIWNIGWGRIDDSNRDAYFAYIANRQQKILDQVNEDFPSLIKLATDVDDNCDLYGIVTDPKTQKEITQVRMYLVPV